MLTAATLLRIDEDKLEVFRGRGRLECLACFAIDAVDEFSTWLARHPPLRRWRILVDLGDESHQLEALPRLRGADRRALIDARLRHWFDQPIYARAQSLGHEGERERFLFSGLNRPERISPVVDCLEQAGRQIERILAASELLAAFLPPAQGLVLSFSPAGMRLTVTDGRQLRLSRLLRAGREEDEPQCWQDEFERTLRYADELFADATTTVSVVAVPGASIAVAAMPPAAGLQASRFFDPAELATPIRGRDASDSTAALLSWLARAPARLQWPARRDHGRHSSPRLWQAAAIAAMLPCAACGIGTASNWAQARELAARAHSLAALAGTREQALQQHTAATGADGYSAEQVVALAAALADADRRHVEVAPVFTLISAVLEPLPALDLQQLRWSAPGSTRPRHIEVAAELAAESPAQAGSAIAELRARLDGEGRQALAELAQQGERIHLVIRLPLASDSAQD